MSHALVILCGGNSSRMGTDKALLPFGEKCLIEYLVNRYRPYFPKIYLSVKKKGDYAHLQLPVTEIPDIYPNAGPMSGVFSGLSMIDEETAFFLPVDTPFVEPETGIALLDAMEDYDICIFEPAGNSTENPMKISTEKSSDFSVAAYSKNCTIAVGKCLLLHQFTFETLREKCRTKYLTWEAVTESVTARNALPKQTAAYLNTQFFHLDTREDYYKALQKLGVY